MNPSHDPLDGLYHQATALMWIDDNDSDFKMKVLNESTVHEFMKRAYKKGREGEVGEKNQIKIGTLSELRTRCGFWVGAASMCWEKPEKAGVFLDHKAVEIIDQFQKIVDEAHALGRQEGLNAASEVIFQCGCNNDGAEDCKCNHDAIRSLQSKL